MTLVRIVKSWSKPDLLRQTPGSSGLWGDIRFTLDPVDRCDYLVALNHIPHQMSVEVPPAHIWTIMQEPPEPVFRWMEKGIPYYGRVFTQNLRLRGKKFIHTHGSLPWHLNRTYDQLVAAPPPEKTRDLSWITSNLGVHPGHRRRLHFLARLQKAKVPFDLFGRGFQPVADKWDGIAPYRYSIAVENHPCPHYWTEKIADCFLAWTMPIYFGATNIAHYFPEGSYAWINIEDPDAPRQVAEIISSDRAEKNRDAIAEARRRVLQDYNMFPRLVRLIAEDQAARPHQTPQRLTLPHVPDLSDLYATTNSAQRAWLSIRRRLGLPRT